MIFIYLNSICPVEDLAAWQDQCFKNYKPKYLQKEILSFGSSDDIFMLQNHLT